MVENEINYSVINKENYNNLSISPNHMHTTNESILSGYASVFLKPDMAGDIIMPGAFMNCLRKKNLHQVKMLYQHDPTIPLGVWDLISEDTNGLFVSGRLLTDIQKAREIACLIKKKALDGLSIGYKSILCDDNIYGGGRKIYEIDLYEISIVTFPMHQNATINHF